jgi:2,3-bisphosphoglycerate-dependent phosphoglycerate mutase
VGLLDRLRHSHPGERIIVSTHGNLMALILKHFDGTVDYDVWSGLTMPDIYRIVSPDSEQATIKRLWAPAGTGDDTPAGTLT